ncbi:MAG: GNAT family N-acetyltransferase [Chloroflexota bacterium]
MINIRRIRFAPNEGPAAKRVVYRVAHAIFNDPCTLEDSITYYESKNELGDMDNIQKNYFENGGIFLVMTDNDQIICTGAIRKLEDDICELKRLWLLTEYHRQGLGYRMLNELLSFAKEKNYKRIRLETDSLAQSRAVEFYKQIGFYEIPSYTDRGDELAMEMFL